MELVSTNYTDAVFLSIKKIYWLFKTFQMNWQNLFQSLFHITHSTKWFVKNKVKCDTWNQRICLSSGMGNKNWHAGYSWYKTCLIYFNSYQIFGSNCFMKIFHYSQKSLVLYGKNIHSKKTATFNCKPLFYWIEFYV